MNGMSTRTRTSTRAFMTAAVCALAGTLAAQQPQNSQSPGDQPHSGRHDDGRHMEHRFDDAARWAKSFDDPARDAWQMPTQVVSALGLKRGDAVADIGAGTGYFTVRLARDPAAPKVYAVDIEASMVEYIRQRCAKEGLKNVTAIRGGADHANLPEPVDVVLIVDTYHHIPQGVAYFTGLKKMLKPSARLAIIDFRKGAPDGPPEEFRFTPDEMSAELGKAGFVLQRQHDFLPRQNFLIYQAR